MSFDANDPKDQRAVMRAIDLLTCIGGEVAEFMSPKSEWGDGPWQEEPDYFKVNHPNFHYYGLHAKRNRMGAWCGYIVFSSGTGSMFVDCPPEMFPPCRHGYWTFDETVKHVMDMPVGGPDGWHNWEPNQQIRTVGFDCAHGFDYAPALGTLVLIKPDREEAKASYRNQRYVMDVLLKTAADFADVAKKNRRRL